MFPGCIDESCDGVFSGPSDLDGDDIVDGAAIGLLLAAGE